MRTSRLFRLVVRIFLLLLTSSMSFVSFLGGYSAVLIFTDEESIDIDLDYEGSMFDVDPTNFSISIEFKINNKGYFDLEDLKIDLELTLEYEWVNWTPGYNLTFSPTIFEGDKEFKTIKAGVEKKNEITIDFEDLEPLNFTDIAIHANKYRLPVIEFVAKELKVSAKYSLGLISFKVEIEDFELGDFEGEV